VKSGVDALALRAPTAIDSCERPSPAAPSAAGAIQSADTAFTVGDLGRGDDFNGNLLDKTLKAAALTVLPGRSHLIAVVPGEDGKPLFTL
jgi:hypothetical protein